MKRKILNVRSQLESLVDFADTILTDKYIELPPIFKNELAKMRFLASATLRKHGKKQTRKDIQVERE